MEQNENRFFPMSLKRHCRPLVTEINIARYMKKFIDRLHIPPYLLLGREDDDDVTDIGKYDFRSVLRTCYRMLNCILNFQHGDWDRMVGI